MVGTDYVCFDPLLLIKIGLYQEFQPRVFTTDYVETTMIYGNTVWCPLWKGCVCVTVLSNAWGVDITMDHGGLYYPRIVCVLQS